ncbi:DUF2809 domain-containing protein [Acaryochloris sp. IP29b_bin.137]|uniref:ribosomal maturation YjgA family protein n=1 Tax=Acaryochloris sp. IP29b_bin.137 TaxID=2969217 RepID=UPI002635AF43|nr:DUF2809 domain-containing protein [Acaryochloris sp. IP29b_bin.137]
MVRTIIRDACLICFLCLRSLIFWYENSEDKRYRGLRQAWLNKAFAGIPHEIFWILVGAYIWPAVSPEWIAIAVCLTTCGLEFLQLWQPAWLQAIRATLLGRLVLGNTFSWEDFPYYFVGSGLGWLGLRWLK